jgi:hypothetical protein
MTGAKMEAEILNVVGFKFTFLRLQEKMMIEETLEDLSDEVAMFFECGSGNQDVIHIDENLPGGNEVTKDGVHHGLKYSRGIGEAKKHDKGSKHATVGLEGGLPFIPLLNADIVVAPADVEYGEDLGILEFFNNISNKRERVLVFDGEIIEFAVILNGVQLAVLFLNTEERGVEREFRGADKTASGHISEEGVEGSLFSEVERVYLTIIRGCNLGFEVNGMIEEGPRGKGVRGVFRKDHSEVVIFCRDQVVEGFYGVRFVGISRHCSRLGGMTDV